MNRKALSLLAAILLSGLVGCNTQEGGNNNANGFQSVGYYSNEQREDMQTERNYGNGKYLNVNDRRQNDEIQVQDRNEGPVTEILDGQNTTLNNNRGDLNYHGQLDDLNDQPRTSYYNGYNGKLVEQISSVVENNVPAVNHARAVVNNDKILVAINTNNGNNQNVERNVEQYVRLLIGNQRDIHVVSDNTTFTRVRQIDNNLRDGISYREMAGEIKDLFNIQ